MLGPIGDSHQSGDWRIRVLPGEQKDITKPIIIVSAGVASLRSSLSLDYLINQMTKGIYIEYHLVCPRAAISSYHKMGGLQQLKFLCSQLWRPKFRNWDVGRAALPLMVRGEKPFLSLPASSGCSPSKSAHGLHMCVSSVCLLFCLS